MSCLVVVPAFFSFFLLCFLLSDSSAWDPIWWYGGDGLVAHAPFLLPKCDDVTISFNLSLQAPHLCLKCISAFWRASSDRSSHSNKSGPLIFRSRALCCLSASFQKSHSAFSMSCLDYNLSANCTASHFVHPLFQNLQRSCKFCLELWVRVEERGGLLLARV